MRRSGECVSGPACRMSECWAEIERARQSGQAVAVATVIGVNGSSPRSAGARMVVWPDGRIVGTVGGGHFEKIVVEAAIEVIAAGSPRRLAVHLTRDLGMCCGGAMEVFIEPVKPAEHLVVFGAGHVAKHVASFAREAGWEVRVVDEREDWATAERFPGCSVQVESPRRMLRDWSPPASTYVLIVTHDHALDQDILEILLPQPLTYLGLIGSRAKVTKFFLRLRAGGTDPALFNRVSGPVGLDLGAETPAEIAVSILAEMVQVRRGRTGEAGRMRLGGE